MSGRGREPRRSGQVLLPLLDRLIDDDPDRRTDPPQSGNDAMDILRMSVRRDLEMLLNARQRFLSWPASLRALDTSPLSYGIPDCTAGSYNDAREREALRADIEATIRRFEPRFARVTVTLSGNDGRKLSATLRLRVDALLHAEPAPEPMSFDTVVDAVTSEVTVQSAGYA